MIRGRSASKRATLIVGIAFLMLATAAAVNVVPSAAVDPPPPIAAEPLTARSVFPDVIDMKLKLKSHDGGTTVVNVDDPSRTVDVRYTVQPGAHVGRTGVLTPLAILKPVNIGGVTVSRATLHNLDEINRLGIKIGDTVIVGRAGDVIPDIKKVLVELRVGKEKEFKMPKSCPNCGGDIEKISDQVAYKCTNAQCPAREREGAYHFVSRTGFNIEGLGPQIINQLFDAGLIKDVCDLFNLTKDDLLNLERFGEKSAQNLIDNQYGSSRSAGVSGRTGPV